MVVHVMHTCLVSGWAGSMTLYELLVFTEADPELNTMTRSTRAGTGRLRLDLLGHEDVANRLIVAGGPTSTFFTLETIMALHIVLAGLLFCASFFHYTFWDLDVFIFSGQLVLNLNKMFGIHLLLAGLLCYGFGYGHLQQLIGMWAEDSYGLDGTLRHRCWLC